MFVAATDWSGVAAVITALALASTAVMTALNARVTRANATVTAKNEEHLASIVPKVTAIDNAVNGQPPGAEHMVEKVSNIETEQGRVKDELAAVVIAAAAPPIVDQWEIVAGKLDAILAALVDHGPPS